jgi:hypothetical protein
MTPIRDILARLKARLWAVPDPSPDGVHISVYRCPQVHGLWLTATGPEDLIADYLIALTTPEE